MLCNCDNCKKAEQIKKLEEQRRKDAQINLFFTSGEKGPKLSDISFFDRIYLGALLQYFISENQKYIEPIGWDTNFAINNKHSMEILENLEEKKIIKISEKTNREKLNVDPLEDHINYYNEDMCWALNLADETGLPSVLTQIKKSAKDPDMVLSFWMQIASVECADYFEYMVSKYFHYNFTCQERSFSLFGDLLKKFSVSQVYFLIYCSINRTGMYKMEHKINNRHAVNIALQKIRGLSEKFSKEGAKCSEYNRIKGESLLSRFFFYDFLEIGERGFYSVPHVVS